MAETRRAVGESGSREARRRGAAAGEASAGEAVAGGGGGGGERASRRGRRAGAKEGASAAAGAAVAAGTAVTAKAPAKRAAEAAGASAGADAPKPAAAKTVATPWGPARLVDELSLPQEAGDRSFASLVQLLEAADGERLVRFAYATDGVARRGPVTLRGDDLALLRRELAAHEELRDALDA